MKERVKWFPFSFLKKGQIFSTLLKKRQNFSFLKKRQNFPPFEKGGQGDLIQDEL
ncbi:MAG: hypothetical protein ABH844_06150 [Candidatus Omnitrophota bacterium]